MAQKKLASEPEVTQAEETQVVKLQCKKIGVKSRDFTPAHARALLALQKSKSLSDWEPADEAEATAQ